MLNHVFMLLDKKNRKNCWFFKMFTLIFSCVDHTFLGIIVYFIEYF